MENNYFRYIGQKCPVCDKEFNGNDDIVVCPLCGTPHHRDCYKKNGECGNFDEHNKGFRWSPEEVQAEIPSVEPQSEASSSQPQGNEGSPFNQQQAATAFYGTAPNPLSLFPKELEDGVETEAVAEFVQVNAFKYIQNFFYVKSKRKSFNWVAFLLAPYWFFYRKLHKIGAIFLGIILLSTVLFSVPDATKNLSNDMYEFVLKYETVERPETKENLDSFISEYKEDFSAVFKNNPVGTALYAAQLSVLLIMHLLAGFTANKWYCKHTVKKIRKIKSETQDTNQQKLLYFKEGGISLSATIIAILGYELVMAAVSYLFQYL